MRNGDILTFDPNWKKIYIEMKRFILGKKNNPAPQTFICFILKISKVFVELQSRWVGLRIMHIRIRKCQIERKNYLVCF